MYFPSRIRFLKWIAPGVSILMLLVCFYHINKMWIHPDSMVSGGLRFLASGPINFNFATYGPTAYLFAGLLTIILFPIGAILGFWNSPETFELAYRTNVAGSYTFTEFSTICNLLLILASLILLTYASKDQISILHGLTLYPILLLSIPITLFQLSLDTIEPLVFFGMSFCLFVANLQFQRNRRLLKSDFFLVAMAFILTIGMRLNLALFTVPIFLYISRTQFKKNASSKEYYPVLFGVLLTFFTYLPILAQWQVLTNYIMLIRNLAGLSFKFESISRNFEIIFLNFGAYFLLSTLLICLFFVFLRFKPFNDLDRIWLILGFLYLLLFIFNGNGFPKYLVPLLPIASYLFLYFAFQVKSGFGNLREFFGNFKRIVPAFVTLILIIVPVSLGQINFSSQQAKSSFDTRAQLKQILPFGSGWMKDAIANQTVISELTRGNEPFLFDDIQVNLEAIQSKAVKCKELVILSSREVKIAGIKKIEVTCSNEFSDYRTILLTPHRTGLEIEDENQWLGLLSLGTPEDKTRVALGPTYTLLIRNSWDKSASILSACLKLAGCSTN